MPLILFLSTFLFLSFGTYHRGENVRLIDRPGRKDGRHVVLADHANVEVVVVVGDKVAEGKRRVRLLHQRQTGPETGRPVQAEDGQVAVVVGAQADLQQGVDRLPLPVHRDGLPADVDGHLDVHHHLVGVGQGEHRDEVQVADGGVQRQGALPSAGRPEGEQRAVAGPEKQHLAVVLAPGQGEGNEAAAVGNGLVERANSLPGVAVQAETGELHAGVVGDVVEGVQVVGRAEGRLDAEGEGRPALALHLLRYWVEKGGGGKKGGDD